MRNIISITNQFILDYRIHPLPLNFDDLTRICKKLRYRVFSYTEADEVIEALGVSHFKVYAAFTAHYEKRKFVFFDEQQSMGTRLFAIAHEIGHIVLQHNYCGAVGYTQANNVQELEADTFAYQLLAPLCLLRALNITSVRDIESRSLLDHDRAKIVHKALQRYCKHPADDELIKVYGIVRPQRKFDFADLLIVLTVFLVVAAIFTRALPKSQPTAAATQDFFAELRQKQQLQTEAVQTTTATATTAPQTASPSPAQSETVYITRSGERYHKLDCYHIKNRTTTTLALSDALVEGYTACKDCYE